MDILSNPTTKTNLAANRVYASPNLASGNATFRQMTENDLPLITGVSLLTPVYNDSLLIGDANPSQNGRATIAAVLALGLDGLRFGLKPEWVSNTQIRLTPGVAHIQNGGAYPKLASASTKTLSGLSANTWYYLYVFESSGAIDWEWSTTAPAAPYFGGARSKSGDTSRRYVGSFRSNGSSQVQNFQADDFGCSRLVTWRVQIDVVCRALAFGTATTNTNVDLSTYIPASSKNALLRVINISTDQALGTDNSEMTGTDPGGPTPSRFLALSVGEKAFLFHPTNASQQIRYAYAATPAGSGAFIDVYGYLEEV